jgi:hypothetical protein
MGRDFQQGKSLSAGTNGKQATLKIVLHSAGKNQPCTLVLVEENGQWKVQHLNVP